MTIPTLIASHKEKETVTAVKKAYSVLSNAYLMAENEHGSPDNWGLVGYAKPEGAVELVNKLSPYMKITKNCGTEEGCFSKIIYLEMDNKTRYDYTSSDNFARFQLADGSLWYTYIYNENCTDKWGNNQQLQSICAQINIDINGYRKPNTLGRDTFGFYVTKHGIIPMGSADETAPYRFDSACVKGRGHIGAWGANGEGCTAWVVFNENMEYLRCTGLSWNGKTSCE